MTPRHSSRRCGAAFALLALAACGGGGTDPGPTVATVSVALSATSVEIGVSVQATATLRDADGNVLTGTVTWNSSNTTVATISTTGQVTTLAAGNTIIRASLGAVSGEATLTVTAVTPVLSGLTLKDSNGQPLVLTNVAGNITLDFNLTMPAGTSATLSVRIGNVEFVSQQVNAAPAPQSVAGPGRQAWVTIATSVLVNTALTNYSENGGVLTASALAPNNQGVLAVLAQLPGVVQPTVLSQTSVTLQNPNGITGRGMRGGTDVIIDGVSWSNQLTGELTRIQFAPTGIQEVTVQTADYQAQFGSGLSGVISIVTKSGTDIATPFVLNPTNFQHESKKNIGSRFFLSSYLDGTTVVSPQTAEPNLNGNCLYTAGTGIIQPLSVPSPGTLPAGCLRWVRPNTPGSSFLTGARFDLSLRYFYDGKGATGAPGAVTLATRTQTPGASAFGAFGGFGVRNNRIAYNYNFSWGVDKTRITDLGSGVDVNQAFELHSATTPGFTPGPNTLVSNLSQLAQTGANRTQYFKTRWRDGVSNLSDIPLTTVAGNDYTTGEQHSVNLGVDLALVGINNDGGTATYAGPWDGYVFRSQNLAGRSFGFTASGSPSNYAADAAMWAQVFLDNDPTKPVYGESGTVPWWVAGAGGSSISPSLTYQALMNLSATRYGGTGEGYYGGRYGVVDEGGAEPVGGRSGIIRFAWIFTAPSTPVITGTPPFVSGSSASISIALNAKVGLEWLEVGPIFNFSNSGFESNFAHILPGQIPIGTGFGGPLVPTSNLNITDLVPRGLVFYSPSGPVSTTVFNTIGVAARARNLARGVSPLGTLFFSNSGSFTRPAAPTSVKLSVLGSLFCRGTVCSGGAQRFATLSAEWEAPTSVNPFSKFEFYSLTLDRRVNFLAKAPDPTVTAISGGFRWTTTLQYDWSKNCQQGGAMELIGLGQSTDRLYYYKNNPFLSAFLSEPTVMDQFCWTANRFAPN